MKIPPARGASVVVVCHSLVMQEPRLMPARTMVPKGGLEPPRVAPHAPQTCASASPAPSARDSDEVYLNARDRQTVRRFAAAADRAHRGCLRRAGCTKAR